MVNPDFRLRTTLETSHVDLVNKSISTNNNTYYNKSIMNEWLGYSFKGIEFATTKTTTSIPLAI